MGLGTDYIIKYISDVKDAVKGANDLEKLNDRIASTIGKNYATATRIVGSDLQKISRTPITINGQQAMQTLQQIGTVAQTADGSFIQFTETQKLVNGQLVKTTGSIKDVTSQFVKGNLEAEKGNKVFSNLADNVKQLAGRAILTIPIWIALRSAITGVFQGISGGIKNLIDFDLSLQKIRNNLQGTPQEVDAAFKKIRASITQASKETGISTEQLAGAVKRFATLGFSANESLQGALGASKLSIALFGDAEETAGAFARALNILIDRSKGAMSAVDQMNEAFALTSQLEETNDFEIRNVTEALDKFAGTAAGVGLTMNQTLAILAALGTAGRRGSEGATLLSTSFNKLLDSIPKVSKSLGITVQTGESTFETFRKILNVITELSKTPGGQSAAISAISDVFGGARGIKIVQSLVAVKDILDKNIATLPNFSALTEKAGRTMNAESGQAKILGNNLKEMGKSFVTALAGSEDFSAAIVKLNSVIIKLTEIIKPLGTTISSVFSNLGFIAGAAFLLNWRKVVTVSALANALLAAQTRFAFLGGTLAIAFSKGFITGLQVLGRVALGSLTAAFVGASATGVISAIIAAIFSPITIIAGITGKLIADALTANFIKGIEDKNNKAQMAFSKLVDGLRGNLSIPDLTALVEKMTLELKPGDLVKAREIGALRKRLQEQISKSQITVEPVVNIKPLISFEEQQSIAKLSLQNKLDELKLQGATNTQLAQAKILATDQLNIKEDTLTLLNQQLDLEKAIQEEKRLQNKLGSDSIKLFNIAQQDGVEIARQIGDVLAGNKDFNIFARQGGKALEVFKREFEDLFKQQQAIQFFTGERVAELPGLNRGTSIAIQEEALRRERPIGRTELTRAQAAAGQGFTKISQIQATAPVTVNANIDISKLSEVKDQFVKEVTKQLPQAGTDINNALQEALLGKQGQNL
jgi:TP901 family phage tail tape measure protein